MRVVIGALVALAGCDCAYGGPGCGDPALVGLCESAVPLGGSEVTLSFWDDTGLHPVRFGEVHAVPADRIVATKAREDGLAMLDGREPGLVELRFANVQGWGAATFYFPLEVTPAAAPSDDCALEPL
jgi:hypothetical protein